MKKEKSLISKITEISNNAPVTSPIQQENLVSKVNSLTFHTCANSLSKPQNKSFNNEKGYTNDINIINEKEQYWVKKMNSYCGNGQGYNLDHGGCNKNQLMDK